ncbi:MAG TPA: hypothetical protein VI136_20510 [Verrucomicrobiae bacterium]
MHPLDLLINILYFLLMIAAGWWVARKAAKDSESYFLAGKSLPWWVIGRRIQSSPLKPLSCRE